MATVSTGQITIVDQNDGQSNVVLTLYKEEDSNGNAPTKPGANDITYNFVTNTISGTVNSWSLQIPAPGSKKIYSTTATVSTIISVTSSVVLGDVWSAVQLFSTPAKMFYITSDGNFKTDAAGTTSPTSIVITSYKTNIASNADITWSAAVTGPGGASKALYKSDLSTSVAVSDTSAYIKSDDVPLGSSVTVTAVCDGITSKVAIYKVKDGDIGVTVKSASGYIYYYLAVTSQPSAEATTTTYNTNPYDFTTGKLTLTNKDGPNDVWVQSPPTVTTGTSVWYRPFTVTKTGEANQEIIIGDLTRSTDFTNVVTFTALHETSGQTIIHGSRIDSGTVTAGQINIRGSSTDGIYIDTNKIIIKSSNINRVIIGEL